MENSGDDLQAQQLCVHDSAMALTSILLQVISVLLDDIPREPQPYHTSRLSGQEWVMELILGHPDRIRCELGVSTGIFNTLISELQSQGHHASRHVSLEEQLAIFLYACVTGLSTRHLGERFQRSAGTISK